MKPEVKNERSPGRKRDREEAPPSPSARLPLRWIFVLLLGIAVAAMSVYSVSKFSPRWEPVVHFHPVASITVDGKSYYLDRNGVYTRAHNVPGQPAVIEIAGVNKPPAGRSTSSWGDPVVEAAARLAVFVEPERERLDLVAIDIGKDPLEPDKLYLRTSRHTEIIWGAYSPSEPSAAEKNRRLVVYQRENGSLHRPHGPYEFDLRRPEKLLRREIKTPAASEPERQRPKRIG